MVMTISGVGDAHSFIPDIHSEPGPIPDPRCRHAASFQLANLARTCQQHVDMHQPGIGLPSMGSQWDYPIVAPWQAAGRSARDDQPWKFRFGPGDTSVIPRLNANSVTAVSSVTAEIGRILHAAGKLAS